MAGGNYIERARRYMGMTMDAAAAIMDVSVPTYVKREKEPSSMRLREFFALYAEMDETGRELMWKQLALMAKNFRREM